MQISKCLPGQISTKSLDGILVVWESPYVAQTNHTDIKWKSLPTFSNSVHCESKQNVWLCLRDMWKINLQHDT